MAGMRTTIHASVREMVSYDSQHAHFAYHYSTCACFARRLEPLRLPAGVVPSPVACIAIRACPERDCKFTQRLALISAVFIDAKAIVESARRRSNGVLAPAMLNFGLSYHF